MDDQARKGEKRREEKREKMRVGLLPVTYVVLQVDGQRLK